MELIDVSPGEEGSTQVDRVDKALQNQRADSELSGVRPDLKVDARSLSQNLHTFAGSGGSNGQLRNRFQLILSDPQGLQCIYRDDVGERVTTVDVSGGPDISQSDRDIRTIVPWRPRPCLDPGDGLSFSRGAHGCKKWKRISDHVRILTGINDSIRG